MNKQLFVVYYGCGCGENEELILAESLQQAEEWAYYKAVEDYESYEGLHGILDREDIAEENGLDLEEDADEVETLYVEKRENQLEYGAVPYNQENEWHRSLFKEGAFEI